MTELQQRYEAETGQSIRKPPMERKLNEQWIEELEEARDWLFYKYCQMAESGSEV